MKIGLVLSNTPGYSETFFNSKIKGLHTCGHSVVLFTQSKKKEFNSCTVKLAYPIIERNLLKQLYWFIIVFFKLMFHLKSVLKFIQFERSDGVSLGVLLKNVYTNAHILTQQLDWLHFGFATMALGKENTAKSIGAKMAVSLRGYDIAIYPVKHPDCYALLWQKVDKIHTISDDLLNLALQNGLDSAVPVQKITPAIDTKKFKVSTLKKRANTKLSILTIARLHWKKGLPDTLKALSLLKDKGIDFMYTIVGEGELFEILTYTINLLNLYDRVHLTGQKNQQEVIELMSSHELYIQYSRSEGFCNAVLEAQAMGLLCIVSDAEGLSENVLDGKSGWVVPKGEPEKLVEKILKVSEMTEKAKDKIRMFAKNRVQVEFNVEKQQQEFVEFYTP